MSDFDWQAEGQLNVDSLCVVSSVSMSLDTSGSTITLDFDHQPREGDLNQSFNSATKVAIDDQQLSDVNDFEQIEDLYDSLCESMLMNDSLDSLNDSSIEHSFTSGLIVSDYNNTEVFYVESLLMQDIQVCIDIEHEEPDISIPSADISPHTSVFIPPAHNHHR